MALFGDFEGTKLSQEAKDIADIFSKENFSDLDSEDVHKKIGLISRAVKDKFDPASAETEFEQQLRVASKEGLATGKALAQKLMRNMSSEDKEAYKAVMGRDSKADWRKNIVKRFTQSPSRKRLAVNRGISETHPSESTRISHEFRT